MEQDGFLSDLTGPFSFSALFPQGYGRGRVQDPVTHSIAGCYFSFQKGASKYADVQIYYVFASSKECDTYHGIPSRLLYGLPNRG